MQEKIMVNPGKAQDEQFDRMDYWLAQKIPVTNYLTAASRSSPHQAHKSALKVHPGGKRQWLKEMKIQMIRRRPIYLKQGDHYGKMFTTSQKNILSA